MSIVFWNETLEFSFRDLFPISNRKFEGNFTCDYIYEGLLLVNYYIK
jgi:hypothetical protein